MILILIKNNSLKTNFFLIFFFNFLISQEIPNEFLEFEKIKMDNDIGQNWDHLTTFGPLRYQNSITQNDSLNIKTKFGTVFTESNKLIYGYGHFTFKKYFHGYLYLRIVDEPNDFNRFSGIPRDINRGGFRAGETDISGITYEKDWMTIQFGRGRQSWGASSDIQLAISENSPSYDYGMIDLDFKNLKVRYFHGYLESDSLRNNRYITGRGIEWKNRKNLLIGLSEVAIYSGYDRNIDFSYLNPISTHLEIELNQRQNSMGTDGGNGAWQLSIDYLTSKKNRLSFNYLFDEFILDKSQSESGKNHFNAFSIKATQSPFKFENHVLLFYSSYTMVGKNTFRHEDGNNNFVQRNKPLGHYMGSDFTILNFGINWLSEDKSINKFEIGKKDIGIYSTTNNPYDPYNYSLDQSFLSQSKIYLKGDSRWWFKKYFSLIINYEYEYASKKENNYHLNLGIELYTKLFYSL